MFPPNPSNQSLETQKKKIIVALSSCLHFKRRHIFATYRGHLGICGAPPTVTAFMLVGVKKLKFTLTAVVNWQSDDDK